MRSKQVVVSVLFVLPIIVLSCVVAYRNRHNPRLASSPHSLTFAATRDQVATTINGWNAASPEDYVDASDRTKLGSILLGLLQNRGLSQQQTEEAQTTALDLIESLKRGDYDEFKRARIPSSEFGFSADVIKGLERYSSLGPSATPLERYMEIWVNTFRTNQLWSQVLLAPTNAILLRNNTSIAKTRFEFPRYSGGGNIRVESYTTIALDYTALEKTELEKKGNLLVWSLFFMGKEPVMNQARPFMITCFWSEKAKKWIPIDFVHALIENPVVKFRFF